MVKQNEKHSMNLMGFDGFDGNLMCLVAVMCRLSCSVSLCNVFLVFCVL